MAKLHQLYQELPLDDKQNKLLRTVAKKMPKQNDVHLTFLKNYLCLEEDDIHNELANNKKDIVQVVFRLLCKWRDNKLGATLGMLVERIDNAVKEKVFSCDWHRNGKE